MELSRFDAFMPHGMCYMWRWDMLLLQVGSDLLIAAAYFSIPAALFVLLRNRPDIPRGIIRLFVAFILLCGITHLLSVIVVWEPIYLIQGLAKLATATVSVITAIVLWPLIPKIIAMPSVKDLETRNQEIAALNMQLESRLDSLSTLAGGVSHEFNNLLTIITGNAELLELHVSSAADQKKLTAIKNAATRSADICSKMLAYSGSGHFVLEELDLIKIANEKQALELSNCQLSVNAPDVLPQIQGSGTQIHQLLDSLIANSHEAIQEAGQTEGSISVSINQQSLSEDDLVKAEFEHHCDAGEYVVLSVADNGPGLTADIREHMFDPYYSTKFIGRGLGLAAVQGIVRGHNACLFVSNSESSGCTISIAFPLRSTNKTAYNESLCKRPEVILVVDDEQSVLEVARYYLEELGIKALTADNPRDALKLAEKHGEKIDALILDYLMPEETGLQLLDKISKVIKVDTYLTSGFTRGEISDPDIHALLTGFIAKPFSREDFKLLFVEEG